MNIYSAPLVLTSVFVSPLIYVGDNQTATMQKLMIFLRELPRSLYSGWRRIKRANSACLIPTGVSSEEYCRLTSFVLPCLPQRPTLRPPVTQFQLERAMAKEYSEQCFRHAL